MFTPHRRQKTPEELIHERKQRLRAAFGLGAMAAGGVAGAAPAIVRAAPQTGNTPQEWAEETQKNMLASLQSGYHRGAGVSKSASTAEPPTTARHSGAGVITTGEPAEVPNVIPVEPVQTPPGNAIAPPVESANSYHVSLSADSVRQGSPYSIIVTDANGNPVPAGTPVQITYTRPDGQTGSYTAATDEFGRITYQTADNTDAGAWQITASVGSQTANLALQVREGTPSNISVTQPGSSQNINTLNFGEVTQGEQATMGVDMGAAGLGNRTQLEITSLPWWLDADRLSFPGGHGGASGPVNFSVDTANLAPGHYEGTIAVRTALGTYNVTVSLDVAPPNEQTPAKPSGRHDAGAPAPAAIPPPADVRVIRREPGPADQPLVNPAPDLPTPTTTIVRDGAPFVGGGPTSPTTPPPPIDPTNPPTTTIARDASPPDLAPKQSIHSQGAVIINPGATTVQTASNYQDLATFFTEQGMNAGEDVIERYGDMIINSTGRWDPARGVMVHSLFQENKANGSLMWVGEIEITKNSSTGDYANTRQKITLIDPATGAVTVIEMDFTNPNSITSRITIGDKIITQYSTLNGTHLVINNGGVINTLDVRLVTENGKFFFLVYQDGKLVGYFEKDFSEFMADLAQSMESLMEDEDVEDFLKGLDLESEDLTDEIKAKYGNLAPLRPQNVSPDARWTGNAWVTTTYDRNGNSYQMVQDKDGATTYYIINGQTVAMITLRDAAGKVIGYEPQNGWPGGVNPFSAANRDITLPGGGPRGNGPYGNRDGLNRPIGDQGNGTFIWGYGADGQAVTSPYYTVYPTAQPRGK